MNLVKATYLPNEIIAIFRQTPKIWNHKQKLVLLWVIYSHILCEKKHTIRNLSKKTGAAAPEWKIRMLFKATNWCLHSLLQWLSESAMKCYPAPDDRVIRLVGDGSHKEKKGKKSEVNQNLKKKRNSVCLFGFKFILLMASWNKYKFPVNYRVQYPKGHKKYKKENELFREMIAEFTPLEWVKEIRVICDSGFASVENFKQIEKLDLLSEKIRWRFVFSLPKTWKTGAGKHLKNIVKHTRSSLYRRVWINKLDKNNSRKSYWIFKQNIHLKHIGEVTIVLSKKRPNASPKNTKIIVTNLENASERDILCEYQRRWPVEIVFKELKSGLGLGETQITGEKEAIEKASGMSVITYLVIMILMKDRVQKEPSLSVFTLKDELKLIFMIRQTKHSIRLATIKAGKQAA